MLMKGVCSLPYIVFNVWHEDGFVQRTCMCHESYARQVVVTRGRTAAHFGAASRQHGDLGAEVITAADGWMLVLGVRPHVSL